MVTSTCQLLKYWGNIPTAMSTCFMAVTGSGLGSGSKDLRVCDDGVGVNWPDLAWISIVCRFAIWELYMSWGLEAGGISWEVASDPLYGHLDLSRPRFLRCPVRISVLWWWTFVLYVGFTVFAAPWRLAWLPERVATGAERDDRWGPTGSVCLGQACSARAPSSPRRWTPTWSCRICSWRGSTT